MQAPRPAAAVYELDVGDLSTEDSSREQEAKQELLQMVRLQGVSERVSK